MKRKPNRGSFKAGVKRGPRPDWVKKKIKNTLIDLWANKPEDNRSMRNILTGIREYRLMKINHLKNNPNFYICKKLATNAHHIIPVDYSLHGKKALKQIRKLHIPTNLLSVCVSCHSKIHFHHGNREFFKNKGQRFKIGYDEKRFTNIHQALG